jgi:glycosyltransferase involved in cell wall biosynthesis
MRILQVTPVYYPELQFGGPPQKIHGLSQGLARRGHQVRVVTLDSSQRTANHQTVVEGIPVQYLAWAGRTAWQVPLSWRALAEAVRWAQVVHCYGLYNLLCPLAAWQTQQQGKPFLLEPQGMAVAQTGNLPAKRLYHRTFTPYLLRRAAGVIATSPAEAADLAGATPPDRLIVRRNGVDLDQFRALPSGDAFRVHYGIAAGAPLALFIGRISPIKNLEMLLRAFAQAGVPGARLALVGPMLEPDYAAHLRAVCSELALGEAVLFTGPLYGDDKLAALAAADLFVLPSLSESFGNAAAEAVAAGLPVLLTDTCGIAQQIHGRAGLSVTVDQAALASALSVLLPDADQRAMVTSLRSEVLTELSWKEPLDHMERLYLDITNRLPTPALAAADLKTTL